MATPENEALLLEMALEATGAQLERLCRGYRTAQAADEAPVPEERSVRQRLLSGGMVKLELVLSPDEADMILRAIDRAREVHAEPATDGPRPEDASAETPAPARGTFPRKRRGHRGPTGPWRWPNPSWPGTR